MPLVIRILNDFKDGLKRIGNWFWEILLVPSPFAPIMMFYLCAPTILAYLYGSSPGYRIAMDGLATTTGIAVWVMPGIFIFCAIAGYISTSPKIDALLVIPMGLYAVLLIIGFFRGIFTPSALIPALYMITAAWACLGMIRYYHELTIAKRAINALEIKVTKIEGG